MREFVSSCRDSKPEDLLAFPDKFAQIMSEIYNPSQELILQVRKCVFSTASGLVIKVENGKE